MKTSNRPTRCILAAAMAFAGALSTQNALAATWQWRYSGAGIDARGTFVTSDTADASGFYDITAITGIRNGAAITSLYPTGSAIPQNEPYAVDNLIRIGGPGQITVHGFGYTTAAGDYFNPYYADFNNPPSYSEVFTTASSFVSEVPIAFSASPVPEPGTATLLLAGLGAVGVAGFARRRSV